MVNNVIHNNEGYGVVLVKPTIFSDLQEDAQAGAEGVPRLVFLSTDLWNYLISALSSD